MKREIGAAKRRSVKPISMSTASAMPPLLPASISDCIIAPASMNWRKLCTGGKPGRLTAPPAPPVWIASRMVGKTTIGASSCGRRKVCLTERSPSALTTRRLVASRAQASTGALLVVLLGLLLEVVAGLGDEDVVEGRVDELQRADLDPGLVERADHARDVRGAALDLDQDRPAVDRRQQLADPARRPARPRRSSPARSAGGCAGGRSSALSDVRGALGDDPAAVDDPDVVGELVGLLQVLGGEEDGRPVVVEGPHLLPDRFAADRVEAGGRLVEEEHARLVDEGRGEVEAALHPARVAADAAVGGVGEADPLEQGVGALAGLRRWAGPAASPAGGSARGRSSAGRAPLPAARRRSSVAPARASLTTSWPATVARPPVGSSSVVSIRTVVVLPAPLGPRKP